MKLQRYAQNPILRPNPANDWEALVTTNPGAGPPEDNWDFTMVDGNGIDVLGGAGANRHTTTSQMIAPLLTTGVYFAQPFLGAWTFTPSGNTTASAVIVVDFVFVR